MLSTMKENEAYSVREPSKDQNASIYRPHSAAPSSPVTGLPSAALGLKDSLSFSRPVFLLHVGYSRWCQGSLKLFCMQILVQGELLRKVQAKISDQIIDIKTELCFNIGLSGVLSSGKLTILQWLLQETYEPENLQTESFLEKEVCKGEFAVLVEVGPRMSFTTAWSANAVSICQACSLTEVTRMERSRRYPLYLKAGSNPLDEGQINDFAAMVHDRMPECVYPHKLISFRTNAVPEAVSVVPVIERGREALEEINLKMGLTFDEQDLQYYTRLFRDDVK
ncbi:hypothetical protein COCNU_11G004920 [Cocos nucifera]|uniref:Phosphoribosylformylglycinamidine synthase N-terminal domain-containing protein n=1 Tax=Cocos nucifera TaxID=13894 RepID=A0A8K0N9V5_COCNU|nr:hypothetical protein COCNU_11G004920 [Cocos nucifera]